MTCYFKIQYLRNSCATYHIFLAHTEKKICFRFIYNTKKLKCSKLCFYRPKYIRGTSARLIRLLRLRKLIIYLRFQNPVSIKRVLGHLWHLLGEMAKESRFKFMYNKKRLKFCKLCFYLPEYLRGIGARSIGILPLRKLMIYSPFQNLFSFIRVLGHM